MCVCVYVYACVSSQRGSITGVFVYMTSPPKKKKEMTTPAGMGNKEVVCQKCSRRFKRACELGRHFKSCKGTADSSVEPSPINDKRLQCTDCGRRFKRPSGLASHRRAFHADATCNTPEHRTESSSEQCSTTTCKTQQSANATSQQNLHSAGDCVEELKHGPNVSPDDIADIPLLNRLVVPSAKCKLFWTNSDQALDAVLEKECPNFGLLHLSYSMDGPFR